MKLTREEKDAMTVEELSTHFKADMARLKRNKRIADGLFYSLFTAACLLVAAALLTGCAHPAPTPLPAPPAASLPNESLIDPNASVYAPPVGSVVRFSVVCLEPETAAQIGGELRRQHAYAEDLRALQAETDGIAIEAANQSAAWEHATHNRTLRRALGAVVLGGIGVGLVVGVALGR